VRFDITVAEGGDEAASFDAAAAILDCDALKTHAASRLLELELHNAG
jgi:hypothetical protein